MKTTNDDTLKDHLGTTNPFTVPQGYFEQMTERLMENLPEHETPTATITTWQRIRPWFYLAAMFCGIMLGVRYTIALGPQSTEAPHSVASADIPSDDNSYYNEYLKDLVINSHMDDYTVYCCLHEDDLNQPRI